VALLDVPMITPDQLTEEAGFYPGVVVEIVWEQSGPHRREVAYWEDAKEWSTEYMESIRPLTGPMSIWLHAPNGSDCLWTGGQGLYRFFTKGEWVKWSGVTFDPKHDTLTSRPLWAK
jgi:hypothetical protein